MSCIEVGVRARTFGTGAESGLADYADRFALDPSALVRY
jgi:hypothetical protein